MIDSPARRSGCPIAFGLDLLGDRWTLLILRDLLFEGKQTFGEFLNSAERVATNVLADRLDRLEKAGLVASQADGNDRRRRLYRPTDASLRLVPVLVELAYWGATHDPQTGSPPEFAAGYENDRDALLEAMRARCRIPE